MTIGNRAFHFTGTAREIGCAMGLALGKRLEQNINLYMQKRSLTPEDINLRDLRIRYSVEELIQAFYDHPDIIRLPADLIAILANPEVEANEVNFGTVDANIACPSNMQVWHTFGGFPAASKGEWQLIDWPWEDE